MKIITLFLIACLLAGCAYLKPDFHPRPWTKEEKLFLSLGAAAAVADCYTTERALDRGHKELNPLMGKYPSDTRLVVTSSISFGLFVVLAHFYPKYRLGLFGVQTLMSAGFAAHNTALRGPRLCITQPDQGGKK